MVASFQIFAILLTVGPESAKNSPVSRIYHGHYKGESQVIFIAFPGEEYLIELPQRADFEDLGESEKVVNGQFEDQTVLEGVFEAHKRVCEASVSMLTPLGFLV